MHTREDQALVRELTDDEIASVYGGTSRGDGDGPLDIDLGIDLGLDLSLLKEGSGVGIGVSIDGVPGR